MHQRTRKSFVAMLTAAIACAGGVLTSAAEGPFRVLSLAKDSTFARLPSPDDVMPGLSDLAQDVQPPSDTLDTLPPEPPGLPPRLDSLRPQKDWPAEILQRLERRTREKEKAKRDEEKARAAAGLDRPTLRIRGRIMADWAQFSQSPANMVNYGDVENGFEFRRVRIVLRGDAFHVVEYKLEMDFANSATVVTDVDFFGPRATEETVQSTSFKDVCLTINELPVLKHLRIGYFKEPFSLENLTSSKYITFMERSIGRDALSTGRSMGVMAFNCSPTERRTWAIGAFRTESRSDPPFRQDDSGGTSLTMRHTLLPWYDEGSEGRGLLHLGIAYSFRDADDGTAEFQSSPEANLGPNIVDTGNIDNVENFHLLGTEFALVYGPLSCQTEYFGAFVPRAGQTQLNFNGIYTTLSYFLTGENRVYDRESGSFDRVKPFENFFRVRDEDGRVQTGKGAWEVAYRHSYIDLNSADILGGRASNHSLGVNWYLNGYTRLMWNYVNSHATPDAGPMTDLHVFQMRVQMDF